MRTIEHARPVSSAAERTSVRERHEEQVSTDDLQVGVIHTVVLGPPGEVTPTDDVLEYETDDTPRDVVDS